MYIELTKSDINTNIIVFFNYVVRRFSEKSAEEIYLEQNRTWLLCSVLTRPSTLVAIYFDKCSHIPASNVIKALRHNAPLSLLYEDGHPRCKRFRFGVKCAVRRESGQKKTKITYRPRFSKKKKKKKKSLPTDPMLNL